MNSYSGVQNPKDLGQAVGCPAAAGPTSHCCLLALGLQTTLTCLCTVTLSCPHGPLGQASQAQKLSRLLPCPHVERPGSPCSCHSLRLSPIQPPWQSPFSHLTLEPKPLKAVLPRGHLAHSHHTVPVFTVRCMMMLSGRMEPGLTEASKGRLLKVCFLDWTAGYSPPRQAELAICAHQPAWGPSARAHGLG